jgi:hypothetical protein
VPVPVFHPSILLEALEFEIPDIDSLDLELRGPKVARALARRRVARAPKQAISAKEPELAKAPVAMRLPANLIQLAAIQPHLLEIISPRPYVDPSAAVLIPELLPPLDPRWPAGWPGIGWIDFPLDPGGGLNLVEPLPGARKREDDDEEPPVVIPELGTVALLGLGLAMLGIARRRPSGRCVG